MKTALIYANIGGSSLCSIDVGGSFGRDLSAQGEAAMVAFAKEWLTKLFGSEVAAAVNKSSATRWNAAPFALGAMSAASPGGQVVAKGLERADRLHVSRRRGDPRNAVGNDRRRLGERRARRRSRVAAYRRAEGSGTAATGNEVAAARAGLQLMARPKALISWSSGKDSRLRCMR